MPKKKVPTMQYITLGKIPPAEFLKYIPSGPSEPVYKEWFGKKIRMTNRRYVIYLKKGINCVICGLEGAYFAVQKVASQKTEKWHVNLYSKDGKQINIDHIKPTSKGGLDNFKNKQPMCCSCNNKKADKFLES